ncbi:MAG TPA: NAD(P)-binding domain-containing protein, partial [Spirochaetia bacterium]|nr:NAD(P)-binding domain-containing protein [Spirochaetia bacterium]
MAADIGVIGMAVMGQNLARNIESRGYTVGVYNRTAERTRELMEGPGKGKKLFPAWSLEELVSGLATPRVLLIMVQAGKPVDDVMSHATGLLSRGDIIIDGGNSFFQDTIRRTREAEEKGLLLMGAGVSGGEEGALHGPSIMPGGHAGAWSAAGKILRDIAATVDGDPCCVYIGPDGAGHYVKMVHNGIEYGDMQMICETYDLMKRGLGMTNAEMHEVFAE